MALRGIVVPIAGNPRALLESFKVSEHAAQSFSREIRSTGVSAKQAAQLQVQATIKSEARLRSQISEYKRVAAAARHGSREQVAAANLAARAEQRLARELGETATKSRVLSVHTGRAERDIGRATRGALAGSGIFRGLGRSLAFASGGFLAFASAGQFIRGSIDAAVEAAATQKQLAAQFRASGKNVNEYRDQIEQATNKVSLLAGFTRDELTRSFTTAFRATKDVGASLKLQAVAADAARGSHKGLNVVTLALTKAVLGQTGGLRRLGILVPKTAKGLDVLNFVGRKFAGQAQAGTTAQQRFAAAFHNFQETIGTGVLPTFNRLLNTAAKWLSNSRNQQRVQRAVNNALHTTGRVIQGVLAVVRPLASAVMTLSHALGGAKNVAKLMAAAFIGMKILKWASEFRVLAASIRGVAAAEALAGAGGAGGAGGLGGLFRSGLARKGVIPGGLIGAGAAGAALAIAQRGETSAGFGPKALDAQVLNDVVTYRDPFTGKYVMVEMKHGQNPAQAIQQDIIKRHPELKQQQRTGEDVASRNRAAQARAVNELTGRQKGRGGRRGASLSYQISLAQEQLAKDELTATKKDDRATLQRLAALTRQRIAKTKDLKDRTQLYQELGGYESQIQALDQDAASKRQEHAKKEREARQKELKALKDREATLRGKIKDIQGAFRDAVDTARQGIGELFGGPVLNPADTSAANKGILGVRGGGGPTAKTIISDLRAQTAQSKHLQRDINQVVRGSGLKGKAAKELRQELEQQGVAGLPFLDALIGGGKGALRQFGQAFKGREKQALAVATVQMRSQLVQLHAARVRLNLTRAQERQLTGGHVTVHTNVHLDGKKVAENTTTHQQRRRRSTATQRRGPSAGVQHG